MKKSALANSGHYEAGHNGSILRMEVHFLKSTNLRPDYNIFLIFGAVGSGIAAILHLGCIMFGAPWYRFFGAGEKMAQLDEAGSAAPTRITSGIVLVLM